MNAHRGFRRFELRLFNDRVATWVCEPLRRTGIGTDLAPIQMRGGNEGNSRMRWTFLTNHPVRSSA
jgi:hypothetical protein